MTAAGNMGTGAAFPRLDPAEAREIRQMFGARAGFPAICNKFGVSREHVLALCIRRRPGRQSRNQATNRSN